jgi:hypothetical protein
MAPPCAAQKRKFRAPERGLGREHSREHPAGKAELPPRPQRNQQRSWVQLAATVKNAQSVPATARCVRRTMTGSLSRRR